MSTNQEQAMRQAQLGDRVRIQYSRLSERRVDTSKIRVPKVLEFTVGSKDIVASVSHGVLGMSPGDHKRIALMPSETYRDALLVRSERPLTDRQISLDVMVMTIDASPNANRTKPQFELGGSG